jgi:hypothetical protein
MPFSKPKLRHDSKLFARTGFHNFIILIMLNTIVRSFNFFLQNFKFVILLRAALYRPLLDHSKCFVPFVNLEHFIIKTNTVLDTNARLLSLSCHMCFKDTMTILIKILLIMTLIIILINTTYKQSVFIYYYK